jgi:hypothetical protein
MLKIRIEFGEIPFAWNLIPRIEQHVNDVCSALICSKQIILGILKLTILIKPSLILKGTQFSRTFAYTFAYYYFYGY